MISYPTSGYSTPVDPYMNPYYGSQQQDVQQQQGDMGPSSVDAFFQSITSELQPPQHQQHQVLICQVSN